MPNEDSTTDNAELAEKLKNARGHSPAPWRGTDQGDIFDANDVIVATIYDNPDTGLQPLDEETSDFNQALITAAPDLLQALANLLMCPDLNLEDIEPATIQSIETAATALLKARRETLKPGHCLMPYKPARGGEAA